MPVFVAFGLYRAIHRHTGLSALLTLAKAVAVYGAVYLAVLLYFRFDDVPRTAGILQPMLALLLMAGLRALVRAWFAGGRRARLAHQKVLIYGAGSAGTRLLASLQHSHEMQVLGFIDDDPRLQGRLINGVPIHALAEVPELAPRKGVAAVLLAIPSLGRTRRNQILEALRETGVHVRTLPGLMDIALGKVQASDVRELDIEDLLGRDAVQPRLDLMTRHTAGKVVLVTGAGGSIGSELCRQLCALQPKALVLVEQSEFALYTIHHELETRVEQGALPPTELVPLLCSVRDEPRLAEVFEAWRPHIVYHAAAYKHVPLVERNIVEGASNNVLGTWVTARCALRAGVSEFVLISTDKAVRPTNVMGASKRLAEMVLQALAGPGGAGAPALAEAVAGGVGTGTGLGRGAGLGGVAGTTRFSAVRFGNVLGSSGSVVPLFRQQIRNGGPVTVTHPEVTRFFMTIPEAAQLVVQAGAMARGGEVFVLDMGQPVRIMDLARRMIELSGLAVRDAEHPGGDIEIVITGLRPGEKLYEELLIGDNPQPTDHPRIMKAREGFVPWGELEGRLREFQAASASGDAAAVLALLEQLVAGFRPSGEALASGGTSAVAAQGVLAPQARSSASMREASTPRS
ncbi:MAG: polysaccharide biosynthesis protein [Burkholderiales bacterium]|nr:polysaccharide biosynthesis protein [Burkholderiales bacterium]